ncbi:MAG: FAS1-like dehydratase domain-containing protein [Deltaproteobacteria bacterium]
MVRPPLTDKSPFAGLPLQGGAVTDGPVIAPKPSSGWSPGALNEIERGAIRRFAEALGETNPVYFDPVAARAQGHRDVVAPLLFPLALRSAQTLSDVAPPNRTVLSGDQQFESFGVLCAGDRVLVTSRIAEVTQRPGNTGPLEFVVVEEEGRSPEGKLLFRTRRTLIVRAGRDQGPSVGGGG